jgi:hypothetical protein
VIVPRSELRIGTLGWSGPTVSVIPVALVDAHVESLPEVSRAITSHSMLIPGIRPGRKLLASSETKDAHGPPPA